MTRRPERIAWWLNLGGEFEFAGTGARPVPGAALARGLAAARRHLVMAGDRVLGEREGEAVAPTEAAVAWLPTAAARAELRARGLAAVRSPDEGVLRTVCGRAFLTVLIGADERDEGRGFHRELDPVLERIGSRAPLGWLAKREFGTAGRGQRRFHAGRPGEADLAWLRASLDLGGLWIEPLVRIDREFALHGLLEEGGRFRLGPPIEQRVGAGGAWLESCPARLDARRAAAWEADAEVVARALHARDYFGPFGLDGYEYRSSEGAPSRWRSIGELNPRVTMAWTLGLGSVAGALARRTGADGAATCEPWDWRVPERGV